MDYIPLVQSALFIFVLRVVDVSLATLRMLLVVRGYKLISWVLGFIQALVFVIAIREVLSNMDNWFNLIGYAAGFATGTVVGMFLEDRLAIGFTHLRIISSRRGAEIADKLRGMGYGVTELSGRGKDGTVNLLNCSIKRKDKRKVEALVKSLDQEAFITADDIRPVWRGFWRA